MNIEHQITKFILTQTGTYQEQTRRPFVSNVSAEAMQALANDTRDGQNFGVAAMQNAALANLIAIQSTPEGIASVANGWRFRRFRGLMVVSEKSPFAGRAETMRVYYVYTDNSEESYNRNLDPQMRIYFNSETIVTERLIPTANGVVPQAQIMGSYQIVAPVNAQAGNHSNPTTYMVRPEDIYHGAQTRLVNEKLKYSGFLGEGVSADMSIDGRYTMGGSSTQMYNKRSDLAPARYLSRTMLAQQHANKEAALDGVMGQDQEVMFGAAGSYIANPSMVSNTFFALLRDRFPSFTERGFITYGQLCSLFPHLDSITDYSMADARAVRRENLAEDSNHFNGSDPCTMAASLISQVVPGIMMDNFIQAFAFTAMNGVGGSQYNLTPIPNTLKGVVDNLEMSRYVEEFFRRIVTDVLESISMRNQIQFSFSMHADLGADSVIDIQMHSQPSIRYVIPTYNDSLFSSVVTQSYDLNAKISKDLIYATSQVMPSHNNPQTAQLVDAVGNPLNYTGNSNDTSIL